MDAVPGSTPKLARALAPARAAGAVLGGAVGELLPSYCAAGLAAAAAKGWRLEAPSAYCRRCGASAGPGAAGERGCPFCVGTGVPWRRLVRLGPYEGPLGEWVVAMKFARCWRWAEWFGARLAEAVVSAEPAHKGGEERVAVCPVPMHFWRRWGRGYNQAQLIADTFARRRGWPVAPILRRTRHTPPQTTVPVSRRHDNVRASFAIRPVDLRGWEVWLIDDVKTTGSTLGACARLLKAAGAARVCVAVAAVADPKGSGFTRR